MNLSLKYIRWYETNILLFNCSVGFRVPTNSLHFPPKILHTPPKIHHFPPSKFYAFESLNTISGTSFYFDEKDGVFGFNTDSQRGADTFHPFKSGGETKLIYKDKITISATGEYLIQTINENGKYIILANTPASVYKYGTSYVGDTVTIRINGVTPSDIDTTMAASFIIMDLYAGDKVGVWTQRIANAGGDRTLSLEIYKI